MVDEGTCLLLDQGTSWSSHGLFSSSWNIEAICFPRRFLLRKSEFTELYTQYITSHWNWLMIEEGTCSFFFMALHDQIIDFLVVGMDSRIFWLDFLVGLKQFFTENLSCPPCPHGWCDLYFSLQIRLKIFCFLLG